MTEQNTKQSFFLISIFPEMVTGLTDWGVTGRAYTQGAFTLDTINPRDFATDLHGSVDDRPYGGGPGMVMTAPIMKAAITKARERARGKTAVVAMTPQGRPVNERMIVDLSGFDSLIFVAGRYEGIDERVINAEVDMEVSVGDIVVSGGEMPALLVMDSLIRRIPGVLGDEMSAEQDSFVDGLLDCPHYTRPEIFEGVAVPPVLLSGDHAQIEDWRRAQSLRRTLDRRPDLVKWSDLSQEQCALLERWNLMAR
ncbi:MAG: tRNA (guanosine(37)-N1)-methyltransferase TrmD [Luminiphilus sp.]|nr:tRNA (guanosine(37)-N1)-methyltransferase TrmD [Luminiphilus sp.]